MRIQPVNFIWREVDLVDEEGVATRAMAMVPAPRYAKVCARQYEPLAEYPLVPLEARSRASHSHYFASLNDGFDSLPEDLSAVAERLGIKTLPPDGFTDSEHFRAWALCETNWCDVLDFDFDSAKDATTVAKLYRRKDTYAQIMVRGAHITIKEAKSQSHAAMAKAAFQKSKDDVLNLLETMIGVAKGTLAREAGKSA
jgi:hypothetical protein